MPNGQFPTILAGEVLSAALLQSMVTLWGRKDADTPRSNTAALAADPDLLIPVVANGAYSFIAFLSATGATLGSGDINVAFTWPTGATCSWGSVGLATSSGITWNPVISTSGSSRGIGINASVGTWALLMGGIQVGSTPGTLQFEWAQNTSNATATTLKARSWLAAIRTA